jgi:pyrroloquinoline-quinone synthase
LAEQSIVSRLDGKIEAKSLLKHPFYQAWQSGYLSIPMLRKYAAQYYHNEVMFPTYLSAIHSRSTSLTVRQAILSNLWDEEYGENNHPELWLRFCEALGMAREEVQSEALLPETQNLVDTYRDITTSASTEEALAAIYGYERQVPSIAKEKAMGLEKFYGITDTKALEFFTVHEAIDPVHADAEARIIEEQAVDDGSKAAIEAALERALDAQWTFLDGALRVSGLER